MTIENKIILTKKENFGNKLFYKINIPSNPNDLTSIITNIDINNNKLKNRVILSISLTTNTNIKSTNDNFSLINLTSSTPLGAPSGEPRP